MRLLKKSEVDQLKASEQRRDVEEGLKLAKRVDDLRETVANEERSLREFRDKTVSIINGEITSKVEERDQLDRDIRQRKSELAELLVPLDAEWVTIAATKERLEQRDSLLVRKEALVASQTEETARALSGLKSKEQQMKQKLVECDARIRNAERKEEKADAALVEATRIKRESIEKAKEVAEDLVHRESIVASREESATIKASELNRREAELDERLLRLKDREAMLERDLKRTSKQ